MAESKVDILRRILEAWSTAGVDAVLPFVDPEFALTVPPELSAEPDVYRGHDGLRRYSAGFEGLLEDVRFVPEEFTEVGERVMVQGRLTGRGAESGIDVELRAVQIWTLRDGRALRADIFPDLESARDALERSD